MLSVGLEKGLWVGRFLVSEVGCVVADTRGKKHNFDPVLFPRGRRVCLIAILMQGMRLCSFSISVFRAAYFGVNLGWLEEGSSPGVW